MTFRSLCVATMATFAASLACSPSVSAAVLRAQTAQGVAVGKARQATVAFLGLPYAAPPIGADRWKPPQPPAAWKGERKADQFASSCRQSVTPEGFGPWTAEYVVSGELDEDCLYLNIWTPARTAQERLPVLFWIHGGGFTGGSGSVPIYDGATLAAQGIVVVNINYRLGAYGFMAHPELTAESLSHSSGNYGLMDMVAALRWVHDNIAAFGGDAARVTVAGQSAGAAAVHHLIASPQATGLFVRAIAQSGSGMNLAVPDRQAAEAEGQALVKASGGTRLAHLRQLSGSALDTVISDSGGTPLRFGPIIDGWFLPTRASIDANTNDVPMLTGMTADEGTGFNPSLAKVTVKSFREQLAETYGPMATDVSDMYRARNDAEAFEMSRALARDRGLAAMYAWTKHRLQASSAPIYAYLWTHVEPGPDANRYLAFHSSEIPYVFNTLDKAPDRPFTQQDRELAGQLSSYWANWIKQGNPNGAGLPAWRPFDLNDKLILEIGTAAIQPRPILSDRHIELFEKYGAAGGKLGLF